MPLSRTASAKCSAYYTDTAIQYNVSPSIVKKHLRMSKCSLSTRKTPKNFAASRGSSHIKQINMK